MDNQSVACKTPADAYYCSSQNLFLMHCIDWLHTIYMLHKSKGPEAWTQWPWESMDKVDCNKDGALLWWYLCKGYFEDETGLQHYSQLHDFAIDLVSSIVVFDVKHIAHNNWCVKCHVNYFNGHLMVLRPLNSSDTDRGWFMSLDGLYSAAGQTGSFSHDGGEPRHI